MEFKDTGLPLDPVVYRAFTLYSQDDHADSHKEQEFPLRIAQVLNEGTGGKDKELLAFTLLLEIPTEAWGIVEQNFGAEIVSLMRETERHMETRFADISRASDRVKLFCLANCIVGLGDVKEKVDAAEAANPGMPVAISSNFGDFVKIFAAVGGTTSCPELEARFQKAWQEIKDLTRPGREPLPERSAMFPLFEDTRLVKTEHVRAAYEIVVNEPDALTEDIALALHVAEILSTVPEIKNPAAVAAALLDVGIRDLADDRVDRWEDRVGPNVMKLLRSGSLYGENSAAQILDGSEAFRQMAIAYAAAELEELQMTALMLLAGVKGNPDFPVDVLKQELARLGAEVRQAEAIVLPVLGRSGSPALEKMLEDTRRAVTDLIARNMTESKFKPKPPYPQPGF